MAIYSEHLVLFGHPRSKPSPGVNQRRHGAIGIVREPRLRGNPVTSSRAKPPTRFGVAAVGIDRAIQLLGTVANRSLPAVRRHCFLPLIMNIKNIPQLSFFFAHVS